MHWQQTPKVCQPSAATCNVTTHHTHPSTPHTTKACHVCLNTSNTPHLTTKRGPNRHVPPRMTSPIFAPSKKDNSIPTIKAWPTHHKTLVTKCTQGPVCKAPTQMTTQPTIPRKTMQIQPPASNLPQQNTRC